jgi:hypothetical protein
MAPDMLSAANAAWKQQHENASSPEVAIGVETC